MAFTYSDAMTLDRDRVRFAIGDKVVNAGPQPLDANFSDAEIAGLLAIEGTWQRAVAAGFETLTSLWAKHVTFGGGGTIMGASLSDVAMQYRESAKEWRQKYGGGQTSGSQAVIRVDGYSSDIDNIETDYL